MVAMVTAEATEPVMQVAQGKEGPMAAEMEVEEMVGSTVVLEVSTVVVGVAGAQAAAVRLAAGWSVEAVDAVVEARAAVGLRVAGVAAAHVAAQEVAVKKAVG